VSKFSTRQVPPQTTSPITAARRTDTVTEEGGPGYVRDAKSELFLLAVANMVAEPSFYEAAPDRDQRFRELTQTVTAEDPEWVARFVPYLRSEMNMRSAAVVLALESARARLTAKIESPTSIRAMVSSALARADEPAEAVAYWVQRYGRAIPKPVKRGVADAVGRLYTERAALKWDGQGRAWRMGDVVDVVHPAPVGAWQGALFRWLLDRRHGRTDPRLDAELLPTIAARRALEGMPQGTLRSFLRSSDGPGSVLRGAGVTWEWLSSQITDGMDAEAWEWAIPSMGYMALLRNLRNFDQAGVSDTVAEQVASRLADPNQVAASRQFPFRFLSAYRAAPSLRWGVPLQKALTASMRNIPVLPERTLILVDTSSSMSEAFSKDGTVMRWDAAATFGVALGQRCTAADVVSFSSNRQYFSDPPGARTKVFPLQAGEDLLRSLDRWQSGGWFLGGGTDTAGALKRHYAGHDRVVIITDEQSAGGDVGSVISAATPLYTWNLAGYRIGHASAGQNQRHTFGGLTDAAFKMIPLLEAGQSQDWPF
jgi:hypothetical protein